MEGELMGGIICNRKLAPAAPAGEAEITPFTKGMVGVPVTEAGTSPPSESTEPGGTTSESDHPDRTALCGRRALWSA
jgi:hypothetical protein